MMVNLLEYYRKSDGKTKKKILSSIFAEKLILKNGKVAAPVFTEPVQFILKIGKTLRISDTEKDIYALELGSLNSN